MLPLDLAGLRRGLASASVTFPISLAMQADALKCNVILTP
jgi:hypothetical protein